MCRFLGFADGADRVTHDGYFGHGRGEHHSSPVFSMQLWLRVEDEDEDENWGLSGHSPLSSLLPLQLLCADAFQAAVREVQVVCRTFVDYLVAFCCYRT